MYLDQPQHHVQELLNELMWPEHPLGRSLTGTERTLNALDRPQLVNYQRQNYVAASTLVIMAGNLRHPKIVKAVLRVFHQFPPGKRARFPPVDGPQGEKRGGLRTKKTAQT